MTPPDDFDYEFDLRAYSPEEQEIVAEALEKRRREREEEDLREAFSDGLAFDAWEAANFDRLCRKKDEFYQTIRHATKISPSDAEQLSGAPFDISLENLEELPVEIARSLSSCKGILRLNGLKSLSDNAATELGKHVGRLELDGLTDISEKSLLALIRHPQPYCHFFHEYGSVSLSLLGLTEFPGALCKIAAKHRCRLVLGVKEISFETAIGFATYSNYVSLPSLERISAVAALACVLHDKVESPLNFDEISCSGPIDCTEEVAVLCATFRNRLEELYLNELSDVFAFELSKYDHKIRIDGNNLKMSPLAALSLLARGKVDTWSDLDLFEIAGRLTAITDEVACIAAKVEGTLPLNNLTELSPGAAAALSQGRGDLELDGLKHLTDEAALELSCHIGKLSLRGLEHVSPIAAVALLNHGGVSTPLDLPELSNNLRELSDETVRIIMRGKQMPPLKGIHSVSSEVADIIVELSAGDILLTGVTELSPEAAEILAKHFGLLSLGLECLPPAVASALSRHRGLLHLDYLTALSHESAIELLRHRGEIQLGGVAELQEDVALEMAGWQAVIRLPNLNRVTPTAALALLAHGSVITPFDLNAVAASLPDLTPQIAKILSGRNGSLHLDCLTKLSEASARVLAEHTWELYLNGITELSEEAAVALVQHPGRIYLNGLKSLTPECAHLLRNRKNIVTSWRDPKLR